MANTNKFTAARKKALLNLIEKPIPISAACDRVGIDRKTYYNWKEKAEYYNPDVPDTKDYKKYYDFFIKIYQAKAKGLQRLLNEAFTNAKGYETTSIKESYHIIPPNREEGESEPTFQNHKVVKTTQFIKHPATVLFLLERLYPALFGNRLKLDGDLVDGEILREIARLTNPHESGDSAGTTSKSIQESSKELASPKSADKPENWEKLPPQQ